MVYTPHERKTRRENTAGGQEYLIQTCEGIKPYFDLPLFPNVICSNSIRVDFVPIDKLFLKKPTN